MRSIYLLNDDWIFREGFDQSFPTGLISGESVRLPHNACDLPLNYFDEKAYQQRYTYQRYFAWRPEFAGRDVSIVFDGAMADAVVWVNGVEVVAHKDGYTPFEARLTGHLIEGNNLITVRIDGAENPLIPPFGGRIDYLTYAGIYRDAWLKVTSPVSIENMKIETPVVLDTKKTVTVRIDLRAPTDSVVDGTLTVSLKGVAGDVVASIDQAVSTTSETVSFVNIPGLSLWELDNPVLYEVEVVLSTASGTDNMSSRFGFRTADFTPEGFFLNGKLLKIRGLNRHQSLPYVGYAMGRRAHERDAEILKYELKCNLVRTSHYPQSPWFLDHCDRIGLLVFEEIPGWQHIGGEEWQVESVRNAERMIRRDWNHPSIVIWGVRINESPDNHAFYAETNKVARALDPTRQTGGVRCITDSEFLEDVYTMNDFVLGSEELAGANHGRIALRDQRECTGLEKKVPYLVTEFGGHMYPTKRHDQEQRQGEHSIRHLEVLDAMYGDPSISGAIGWCMFDYNTHKDFGSGDRICHHGVLDIFREPKFAAYAYKSQCDPSDEIVMKPVSVWSRGERDIGGILPFIVLTNCDEVEISYGSVRKRVGPDRERFLHLPHPPVVIDHRHFSKDELGMWGMALQHGELRGFIDGREVAYLRLLANPVPTLLEVVADEHTLPAATKDQVRVIVRALDQAGNILPYLDEPVNVTVSGAARLLGPETIVLNGGTVGFWLESTGQAGEVAVTVSSPRFEPQQLSLVTI
ncbi:glycoside hydrolase family 2 TIM barrel-domain containing protein [Neorhizobium sp. JUb45]|uniref:glycoside hydrolase family 2 protein n=1 Tax=unclassified Neorhizobium TaxID=2629175 RepID=UPI00104AC89D|nr:glycoside hydrolase family 2 TIM barrel-domain containing protein [Neorhizobium sp. JUb45]TCQ99944.1 beta-galactosidase [Neorhizobium sp. JUb45]